MSLRPVFYINGLLLVFLAQMMLIPALLDLSNGEGEWRAFIAAHLVTVFTGLSLVLANRQEKIDLSLRETFLMTSLGFTLWAGFSALPFCFSTLKVPYHQAFFEAMSGVTTTGSTVLSGLDGMPHGILLWRAMLQWLGGIGFLIIALAILPVLQLSGMSIFNSQSSGAEKVMPRASQVAIATALIYAALTLFCAALLYSAGMTTFEAFCHAMTTLSTGGFSTSDGSISKFQSPLIELVVSAFMILGALPFVLYLKTLRGDGMSLFKDSQVRAFFTILLTISLLVTTYIVYTDQQPFVTALRNAFFMVTSLMTTTGFSNADYRLWGPFAVGISFLVTFLGGCSGSTVGGVKVFRLQILWKMLQQQVQKLITPHGAFQVRYNDKPLEYGVQAAVAGFFFIYIATWLLVSVLLQWVGLDFTAAVSGAMVALSNAGPGLGTMTGLAGHYPGLPTMTLWIMSFAMLLGRLEFLAVLVLFSPRFWNRK